ncbi:anaerobic carbon-monoxide dehydrogenase catalytic subunit [Sporomusa sphaeroides]|jgi:carbon-monoxide dehydrogenase catalytic subunit|uniref:Carbon monoxide dehydrogenase n=1 Tax=Sporomusa sphaeroides DSM 2875 TaxID=1337886 RepID=A0ABM9W7A4_9FIRM|nr:anaerobic carbon-monoxide dehydrogenase catalytic subunit [Sporomusa sphaeroides]OLS57822.1 carbon monoxide dehydrogenase/acetyl-CoA synthase subunit beta [Sporomusa sphaeroides DSM 2875]CVK20963.1 Carbon monoxide dehydrogenase/acetyl-CoA synthase subunit beta [Sporomusa sphaeroides DSM 2875]HML34819.1 anaerobic carbon-monoxide dehydrogenase catalytic subunit [Sporomusa sphaeroides]
MSEQRTIDVAATQMLDKAKEIGFLTTFDRAKAQEPRCTFGNTGICCRICLQGPCRILPKKPGGNKGICGAADYTIVARNTVRYIAGGAAAHSDHGREIAEVLLSVAEGRVHDYKITDADKLIRVAKKIGVETEGREMMAICKDVASAALAEFGRVDETKELAWINAYTNEERLNIWRKTAIMPSGINLSLAKLLHQTHIGVDSDPVNIIFGGLKAALCDIDGQHLATDLSDILFGTGVPVVTEANLGAIKEDKVNIALHGHNPLLSQMVVKAAKEMQEEAKAAGAAGINLVGICCTGNEVLTREGVAIATNFATQELAIMTGAMDAMVVDVQCIMPSIRSAAECYHTKIVTTMPIMKIPGSYHFAFDEHQAVDSAKEIIRLAIDAYKNRDKSKVCIPELRNKVVAGFTLEAMYNIFRKINPENPMKVVADAIEAGEIKGVAALIGCNNLKGTHDYNHTTIAKELAKNDVLLIATGCSAQAHALAGMMNGDAVKEYAGEGLKKFFARLNAVAGLTEELPLMFHMGSCVDNSRCQDFATDLANTMGLEYAEVPYVVSAPEAMSEKAVAIGSWNVAYGNPTHVGVIAPTVGSQLVNDVVTKVAEDVFGGFFFWEPDAHKASARMVEILEERNWKNAMRKKARDAQEAAE